MKDSIINYRRDKTVKSKLYDMYLKNKIKGDRISNTTFFYKIMDGYTFSEICNMKKYKNKRKRIIKNMPNSREKELYWINYLQQK